MIVKAQNRVTKWSVAAGGLTLIQGPQAEEVGLPVELFHTCWPCGGLENVPLFVPGSLVMDCPLTLHIQARLRCQGDTEQLRRHRRTKQRAGRRCGNFANISSNVSIESEAGLDCKWLLHQLMS